MCWEIEYEFFVEQKKAQDNRRKEQRDGVVAKLLNDANKAGGKAKTDAAPVDETTAAK